MSALLMLAGMRRWTTSRGTLERCGRLPGTIARDDMPYYGCNVAVYRVHENIGRAKNVGLTEHFAGHDQPGYQSEKTYDFSALYISVRNRRIDEFWDAGSRAFVTTTGISTSAGHRPFLNRWLSDSLTR